jgi:predicted GIY-YIG superfamily endonuclease
MYYVYILKSVKFPDRTYIGFSNDLKRRFNDHNSGKCSFTSKYKPWKIKWYCGFHDKYKALRFEKYLKGNSGRAFAQKHF